MGADFVEDLRSEGITPHVAARAKGSRLDQRTTSRPSYAMSQRCRKKVKEIFGWMKTVAGFRKTRHRGVAPTGPWAYLVATAYNLLRMAKLLIATEATTRSGAPLVAPWAPSRGPAGSANRMTAGAAGLHPARFGDGPPTPAAKQRLL